MTSKITILVALLFITLGSCDDLPTLYEYYTADGISSGLSVDQPYFTLNGKNISIYSGTIHYFRVPPQYWQDRLRKLRASGLNTVETSVAWNLHEPQNGVFDFGNGGTEMEQFLDLEKFLKLAQEEDLFVILRPGPYICAEWEWGGLPSWLLAEDIAIRTSDATYFKYIKRYFGQLLPVVAKYQFTRGGPILAFQVENEYGNSPYHEQEHIQQLYDLMKDSDLVELLFTTDNIKAGSAGTVSGLIFQTIDSTDPVTTFDRLEEMQAGKPKMAMEFYPGWFDNWSEEHFTRSSGTFRKLYESVLSYPASVNLYMFYGGSNWGWFNGASVGTEDNSDLQPHTTSYDYDAPITEAGDYTDKYKVIKELLEQYNPIKTKLPDAPLQVEREAYPTIKIDSHLSFDDIIDQAPLSVTSDKPVPMEKLAINDESGQSYGYIVYRKEHLDLKAGSSLTITGHVRDTVMILINGKLISSALSENGGFDDFGFWRLENPSLSLTETELKDVTLDIVVENWGRGNSGRMKSQFKGLTDDNQVLINDEELISWTIIPLEFKKSWTNQLSGWASVDSDQLPGGPGLYKATLTIDDSQDYDNFIDMQGWNKGLVIVNGFPLGKYAFIGPQQTIYLPRPFLQKGENKIIIFEHFEPSSQVKFSENSVFSNP